MKVADVDAFLFYPMIANVIHHRQLLNERETDRDRETRGGEIEIDRQTDRQHRRMQNCWRF